MANAQGTTTSNQFSLNSSDLLKGLLMAVLVPVVTIVSNTVNDGSLTFNWKQITIAAIGGFLGYLTKNFLTPSQIVIKDTATVQAVKEGFSEVKVVTK